MGKQLSSKITVVGSANTDFIVKTSRLPVPGETVTDGEFSQVFGGKGANSAVAAIRAGVQVGFIGAVGDDEFGHRIKENLRSRGIDTSHLLQLREAPGGVALIMVDNQGENSIAVAPGANRLLTPQHIQLAKNALEESAIIMLQMEISAEANRETLKIAAARQIPTLLNYAPFRQGILEIDDKINWLIVNEGEAAILADCRVESPEQAFAAAEKLLGRGPNWVIITLGEAGVAAVSRQKRYHIEAFPVRAVDTTAAGDTFCGALAAALCRQEEMEQALAFASAAAALAVTRIGAQPSIPEKNEIEALLRSRR